MTDTTKTEALRLADRLEQRRQIRWTHSTGESPRSNGMQVDALCMEAAAELRRLSAENTAAVSSFLCADDERKSLRSERDRLAAECEALRAAVLPALQTGLETALELLAQKGEAYGGDSQYVATYKDAVQELRGAITAAMGGKE